MRVFNNINLKKRYLSNNHETYIEGFHTSYNYYYCVYCKESYGTPIEFKNHFSFEKGIELLKYTRVDDNDGIFMNIGQYIDPEYRNLNTGLRIYICYHCKMLVCPKAIVEHAQMVTECGMITCKYNSKECNIVKYRCRNENCLMFKSDYIDNCPDDLKCPDYLKCTTHFDDGFFEKCEKCSYRFCKNCINTHITTDKCYVCEELLCNTPEFRQYCGICNKNYCNDCFEKHQTTECENCKKTNMLNY